jgi:hypothetical protein
MKPLAGKSLKDDLKIKYNTTSSVGERGTQAEAARGGVQWLLRRRQLHCLAVARRSGGVMQRPGCSWGAEPRRVPPCCCSDAAGEAQVQQDVQGQGGDGQQDGAEPGGSSLLMPAQARPCPPMPAACVTPLVPAAGLPRRPLPGAGQT